VFQHTPRFVTVLPPSEVTLPPTTAVICEKIVMAVVSTDSVAGFTPPDVSFLQLQIFRAMPTKIIKKYFFMYSFLKNKNLVFE